MSPRRFTSRLLAGFAFAVLLMLGASLAHAKDVYVLISGGGTPGGNNYSQYLQARAYLAYLHENFPKDSVWSFFGAGNVTGKPPVLSDVVKVENTDGRRRTIYLPGALPDNRPARRADIAGAFRNEILPAVRNGGTLYLLVGDHGSPSGSGPAPDDVGESVITLFGWDRDVNHPNGWRSYANPTETLGVAELRRWLTAGLGRGKVVFVMSQCYGGGFHSIGLPRAVKPNPKWFSNRPGWVDAIEVPRNMPAAAGFTATDDRTVASGCTPDVDSNRWAGYERYLPEQLVGLDLFTLEPSGTKRWSFYDAHVEATKVDQTIDKPRSTSEAYLALWARSIERMKEDDVTPAVRPHLEAFRKALDGTSPPTSGNADFTARQAQFQSFLDAMTASNASTKDLLTASREELQKVMASGSRGAGGQQQLRRRAPGGPVPAGAAAGERMLDSTAATDLFNRHIVPAWRKAIDAGTVPDLSPAIVSFERDVLRLDEFESHPNASANVTGRGSNVRSAAYWHAGYGNPATFDDARAREIEDWVKERQRRITEWAGTSGEEKVRVSAEIYAMSMPGMRQDPDKDKDEDQDKDQDGESDDENAEGQNGEGQRAEGQRQGQGPRAANRPDRKTAAERVHFYREVLAAWQFLLAVNEKPALDRLAELTRLERTPLRK
jgi:hypothetical protein